jgi:hypothetical protein
MTSETDDPTTLEARLQRAEAAYEAVLSERNELWAQLQARTAEQRHVEHLQAVVAAMEQSVSWRITAPLRTLKRLGPAGVLRAVRKRLGR